MKIIFFLHWDNISLRKTKHEKETKTCQNSMSRGKTMSRYIRYSSPSPLLLLDTGGFKKKKNFLVIFINFT